MSSIDPRPHTCPTCGDRLPHGAVFCPHCDTRLPGAAECKDYRYEAFISYRHVSPDREVAVRIQRRLENFAIPRQLQQRAGRRRLGKLFRDEDELPTSSSLSDQISDALEHARYLIVICSPATNESRWVAREIELFSSLHGRGRVRLALVDGEPDESFPTLLRSRLVREDDGSIVRVDEEPLAADFRNRLRRHFDTEILRLAAPLIGCGFDDLRQRIRARRMRLVTAASTAVAAVSVAFGSFSLYQQHQIEQNLRQSQRNESSFLAAEATDLLAEGRRYEAVQVALAALPESASDDARPYVPAAQLALEESLGIYPQLQVWNSRFDLPGTQSLAHAVSATGLLATVAADNTLEVHDLATGTLVSSCDLRTATKSDYEHPYQLAFAGDRLAFMTTTFAGCIDAQTGEILWSTQHTARTMAVSPAQDALALLGNVPQNDSHGSLVGRIPTVTLYDPADGTVRATFEMTEGHLAAGNTTTTALGTFSPDGGRLALTCMGSLYVIDLTGGEVRRADIEGYVVDNLCASADCIVVVSGEGAGGNEDERTVSAFSWNAEQRWSRTVNTTQDSADAASDQKPVQVTGIFAPFEDKGEQVVCLANRTLLLLDVADGTTTGTLPATARYVHSLGTTQHDDPLLVAATADGHVLLRGADGHALSGQEYNTTVGTCADATFAQTDAGVFLVSFAEDPDNCYVWQLADVATLPGAERLSDAQVGAGSARSGNGNGSATVTWWDELGVAFSSKQVVVFDATTNEQRFSVSAQDLIDILAAQGLQASERYTVIDVVPALNGDVVVLVNAADNKGYVSSRYLVVRLSASSGEPVAAYAIEGMSAQARGSDDGTDALLTAGMHAGAPQEFFALSNGTEAFVACTQVGFFIADALTGETLAAYPRPTMVYRAFYVDDGTVVTLEPRTYPSSAYGVHSIDLASGEARTGALEEATLRDQLGGDPQDMVALSPDYTRLVAVLDDTTISCFDTRSGKRLWTTEGLRTEVRYLAVPTDDAVFVQDDSGICQLYDLGSGAVRGVAEAALPAIETSWIEGDDTLAVQWKTWQSTAHERSGMALVSLDDGSFGPTSSIADLVYLSADGTSVVVEDVLTGAYFRLPRRDLDALVREAREAVVGHELSEAERHLYHVE